MAYGEHVIDAKKRRGFISLKENGFVRDVLRSIYHAKDKHQCYYQPRCVVCWVKTFLSVIWLSMKLSRVGYQRK